MECTSATILGRQHTGKQSMLVVIFCSEALIQHYKLLVSAP